MSKILKETNIIKLPFLILPRLQIYNNFIIFVSFKIFDINIFGHKINYITPYMKKWKMERRE